MLDGRTLLRYHVRSMHTPPCTMLDGRTAAMCGSRMLSYYARWPHAPLLSAITACDATMLYPHCMHWLVRHLPAGSSSSSQIISTFARWQSDTRCSTFLCMEATQPRLLAAPQGSLAILVRHPQSTEGASGAAYAILEMDSPLARFVAMLDVLC